MLSDQLIVFLVIIAAAAFVTTGFAVNRLFGRREDADNFNQKKPEQMAYMREVRERNFTEAFGDSGPSNFHQRAK